MKFIRRPDLDPHPRIEIVKNVWNNQGIYSQITQIDAGYLLDDIANGLWQIDTKDGHNQEDNEAQSTEPNGTSAHEAHLHREGVKE